MSQALDEPMAMSADFGECVSMLTRSGHEVDNEEFYAAFSSAYELFGIVERASNAGTSSRLPAVRASTGADRLAFLVGCTHVFPLRRHSKWVGLSADGQGQFLCSGYLETLDALQQWAKHNGKPELWLHRPSEAIVSRGKPCNLIFVAHRGSGQTNHINLFSRSLNESGDLPKSVIPENTVMGFAEAMYQGADGIEFDVILMRDGNIVVCHDDVLEINEQGLGTAGRDEAQKVQGQVHKLNDQGIKADDVQLRDIGANYHIISQMDYKDLKNKRVGHDLKIPLLSDVLDLVVAQNRVRHVFGHPRVIVNIELKGVGIGEATAKEFKRFKEGLTDPCHFQMVDVVACSFQWRELTSFASAFGSRVDGPFVSPAVTTNNLFGASNVEPITRQIKEGATLKTGLLQSLPDFYTEAGGAQNGDFVEVPVGDFRPELLEIVSQIGIGIALFMPGKEMGGAENYSEDHLEQMRWALSLAKTYPVIVKVDEPCLARRRFFEMAITEDDKPTYRYPPKFPFPNAWGTWLQDETLELRRRFPQHFEGAGEGTNQVQYGKVWQLQRAVSRMMREMRATRSLL